MTRAPLSPDVESGLTAVAEAFLAGAALPSAACEDLAASEEKPSTAAPPADVDLARAVLALQTSPRTDDGSKRPPLREAELLFLLGDREPGEVLDLMCGPAPYLETLVDMGRKPSGYTGVDHCGTVLEHARGRWESARRRFVLADVRRYRPTPRSCDTLLLTYEALNQFTEDTAAALLRRAANALRPGGRMLLDVQLASAYWNAIPSRTADPRPRGGELLDTPHTLLATAATHARGVHTSVHAVTADGTCRTHLRSTRRLPTDKQLASLLRTAGLTVLRRAELHSRRPSDKPEIAHGTQLVVQHDSRGRRDAHRGKEQP